MEWKAPTAIEHPPSSASCPGEEILWIIGYHKRRYSVRHCRTEVIKIGKIKITQASLLLWLSEISSSVVADTLMLRCE